MVYINYKPGVYMVKKFIKTVELLNLISKFINDELYRCQYSKIYNYIRLCSYVESTMVLNPNGMYHDITINIYPKFHDPARDYIEGLNKYKTTNMMPVTVFEKIEQYNYGSVNPVYVEQMIKRLSTQIDIITLLCYDRCMSAICEGNENIPWVRQWFDSNVDSEQKIMEYKLAKMGL